MTVQIYQLLGLCKVHTSGISISKILQTVVLLSNKHLYKLQVTKDIKFKVFQHFSKLIETKF